MYDLQMYTKASFSTEPFRYKPSELRSTWMTLFIKYLKYKDDMVKIKTKHDTKIWCSNNFKTEIFEILHLEDFYFVPYKRRFIAATKELVFSGLSERLPNYCHFVK